MELYIRFTWVQEERSWQNDGGEGEPERKEGRAQLFPSFLVPTLSSAARLLLPVLRGTTLELIFCSRRL